AKAHPARTWILDHQPLLDTFIRLQTDNELVGDNFAGMFSEDRIRDRLKGDDDFRNTGRKAFACTHVKRNASPTPVVDFGLQRHKSFAVAVVAAKVFEVALNRTTCGCASAILAAYRHVFDISRGNWFERTQYLDLFVMDGIGFERRRWLHGD